MNILEILEKEKKKNWLIVDSIQHALCCLGLWQLAHYKQTASDPH